MVQFEAVAPTDCQARLAVSSLSSPSHFVDPVGRVPVQEYVVPAEETVNVAEQGVPTTPPLYGVIEQVSVPNFLKSS